MPNVPKTLPPIFIWNFSLTSCHQLVCHPPSFEVKLRPTAAEPFETARRSPVFSLVEPVMCSHPSLPLVGQCVAADTLLIRVIGLIRTSHRDRERGLPEVKTQGNWAEYSRANQPANWTCWQVKSTLRGSTLMFIGDDVPRSFFWEFLPVFAYRVFPFAYLVTFLTFFGTVEFMLQTGDNVNLFRQVGY